MPDEKRIKAVFENDFSALIHKAQSCGAEPFGFAKIAARKFPTIQKWLEYGWASAYENADISVTVSLTRWDA